MSVKFLNFTTTLAAVSIHDEAIDKAASDMAAYQKEYDVSHLKFHEGQVPTYFHLSNVSGPDLVSIQQEHYVTELPEIKPGMSPDELKNLKINVKAVDQGGMLVKYFKASCKKITDGSETIEVNDEVVKTIPGMILQELGSFVMTRSIISDSKKK